MKHRISIRDGKVYVVASYALSGAPKMRHYFYPTDCDRRTAEAYGIVDGEPVESRENGNYALPNHFAYGRFLTVQLTNGGRTVADLIEDVDVPCPKVRAGVETRWNESLDRGWEKYLKTRGWVPA